MFVRIFLKLLLAKSAEKKITEKITGNERCGSDHKQIKTVRTEGLTLTHSQLFPPRYPGQQALHRHSHKSGAQSQQSTLSSRIMAGYSTERHYLYFLLSLCESSAWYHGHTLSLNKPPTCGTPSLPIWGRMFLTVFRLNPWLKALSSLRVFFHLPSFSLVSSLSLCSSHAVCGNERSQCEACLSPCIGAYTAKDTLKSLRAALPSRINKVLTCCPHSSNISGLWLFSKTNK